MNLQEMLKNDLSHGKFWNKAWSLVEGCTPVSPGCANCWLARLHNRNLPNIPQRVIGGNGSFNGTIDFAWDRIEIPYRRRKPTVYAIWSDFFHESVYKEFRDRAFTVMSLRPQHKFIIVTKRPHIAADYLSNSLRLSNVIILVTMEDQERVNERLHYAFQLSFRGWNVGVLCEPLLSPIDLGLFCETDCVLRGETSCHGSDLVCKMKPPLKWIIAGGESGPNARPANIDWIRSLRDQAQAAKVPFLFKQWGEWVPETHDAYETGKPLSDVFVEICDDGKDYRGLYSCRVGKKKAGRTLDGREWLEVPEI